MTLEEAKHKYPQIAALHSILEVKRIKLTALPTNPKMDSIYFREIEFSSEDLTAVIPLDDEYEDAEKGNQALMLQLIIYAVEEYEDCEDFFGLVDGFWVKLKGPFYSGYVQRPWKNYSKDQRYYRNTNKCYLRL